jgi:hypothetical protein
MVGGGTNFCRRAGEKLGKDVGGCISSLGSMPLRLHSPNRKEKNNGQSQYTTNRGVIELTFDWEIKGRRGNHQTH